jgi:uncharacterized protein
MLPRELDPIEVRVLGSLLEKEQTTPEYYPLTINALLAACNQKSNREPVLELAEADVRGAVGRLRDEMLVWESSGARVVRYEHTLDRRLELDAQAKALLTVLFLRGPQTPGELRSRTERMCAFASLPEVEAVLRRMAGGPAALVAELPRRPGQKETRWAHLAAGTPEDVLPGAPPSVVTGEAAALAERVAELEARLAELAATFERLLEKLGER